MQDLTLLEIDQIRKSGYRPQVVGCFLKDKKILFVYKKEYDLWQLPQGGIDNKEIIEDAFFRETGEELGDKFLKSCDKNILLVGDDKVDFPSSTQGARDLKDDLGEKIFMKGKCYFFICCQVNDDKIDISDTEFDDYKWISYEEAINLCNSIYQKGKKRITIKALNLLKQSALI
ncbi:MAG: NUDIX domain-containing protein [Candidatus Buchananbacteria bacterium]